MNPFVIVPFLAITLAFPLSCFLMSKVEVNKRWKIMEYLRGAIVAIIVAGVNYV